MMDEDDVRILRKESEYVAKEIVLSGKFQDIVYELKEHDVIAPDAAILLLNRETTKTSKTRHLLLHLETCKPGTLEIFIKVLMKLGLFDVAERLHPETYDHHRSIIRGDSDELDLKLPVNVYDQGPNPRHYLGGGTMSNSDGNGNNPFNIHRPLKIKVIPAKFLGGGHQDPSTLYKNSSMPRGLVFMVNYKNFHGEEHPERVGSEKDVANLSILFTQMGYRIPEVHVNLTKYDTILALRKFKDLEEHKSVDSCVVIIMSHGRDEKSFYTSDNNYMTVNDVVERFSNRDCEALKGKPKIFIFQYCRGTSPDVGVAVTPVKYDGGIKVETDAASHGEVIIERDPTYTDMYIVYSTLEGFVSFRHPERGSWLMEALCTVFMNNAHDRELEFLMKMVSRQVRQNLTDEGNKQVCEFVQRGFDRHFYFNPTPLNSMERLDMRPLSHVLSASVDSLEGAASPVLRTVTHQRQLRPLSWSRGSTPDPYESPGYRRQRNFSGASNSSDYNADNVDISSLTSENVIIHPRARRRSGNQRHASENLHFLQPSHIQDSFNRSFSENPQEFLGAMSEPLNSPKNDVFIGSSQDDLIQHGLLTYDTVDHPKESSLVQGTGAVPIEDADINMNQAVASDTEDHVRHSVKRQLSIPSTNETLTKINDVKKFLQVHDSDPKLLQPLQRIESFVNKKKYEGKRRKKDTESSSLEY